MKKLTIGSAVYDDFEGVYFSYQSLRLNNKDILKDLDLLIIDNNPESEEGKATKHFCSQAGIRYIPYTKKASTAIRNEIFKNAEGEFCLSMDPHVLFEPDTIKKLISFLGASNGSTDLYHGPMLYDQIEGHDPVVQMDPVWRDHMFGTWKSQALSGDEPFEIPMHGLGVFACNTSAWLEFNENFNGFGGEEGYIHEKFRQAGRKIWCLPFFKWIHRFQRPRGIAYKLDIQDRIRNYLLGWLELKKDPQEVIDHFNVVAPDIDCHAILKEVDPNATVGSPDTSAETKWTVSSMSFSNPIHFKFLRLQFYEDCVLNKVHILPSREATPALNFVSPEGVENPSHILDDSNEKTCTIAGSTGEKEILLEYPGLMQVSVINFYHTNRRILCSVGNDLENWSVVGVI